MQAPTAELALQDWARENNVFDLLPVITEHGYLSVESLSHIDKQTVYDMGIRKPGDGMRLQLAVLKFHILGKRPARSKDVDGPNVFWECRFCQQVNPRSVYNCRLCLSPKPESTNETELYRQDSDTNLSSEGEILEPIVVSREPEVGTAEVEAAEEAEQATPIPSTQPAEGGDATQEQQPQQHPEPQQPQQQETHHHEEAKQVEANVHEHANGQEHKEGTENGHENKHEEEGHEHEHEHEEESKEGASSPCRFYRSGECRFGSSCLFAHVDSEGGAESGASSQETMELTKVGGQLGEGAESKEASTQQEGSGDVTNGESL